jgi:hypothetical protein
VCASQVRFRDISLNSGPEIYSCRIFRFKIAPPSLTDYRNVRKLPRLAEAQWLDIVKMIGLYWQPSASGNAPNPKLFCLQREQLLRSQFFGTVSSRYFCHSEQAFILRNSALTWPRLVSRLYRQVQSDPESVSSWAFYGNGRENSTTDRNP